VSDKGCLDQGTRHKISKSIGPYEWDLINFAGFRRADVVDPMCSTCYSLQSFDSARAEKPRPNLIQQNLLNPTFYFTLGQLDDSAEKANRLT
jgi:hypothetical protein